MKHCLIALLIVLPASVAGTSAHTRLERSVEVAMVDPADLSPPQNANDMATGQSDVAHIAYTPARSPSGPSIFQPLLNNASYNGERHAHLRGDIFEWQWRENAK